MPPISYVGAVLPIGFFGRQRKRRNPIAIPINTAIGIPTPKPIFAPVERPPAEVPPVEGPFVTGGELVDKGNSLLEAGCAPVCDEVIVADVCGGNFVEAADSIAKSEL